LLFKIASCNNRKSISACEKQHFRKRFLIASHNHGTTPRGGDNLLFANTRTHTHNTHEMPYNRVWQISLYALYLLHWRVMHLHAFGFRRSEGGWTCRRRRIHARCVDIRVAYMNSLGRVWSCVKISSERTRGGPAGYARLGSWVRGAQSRPPDIVGGGAVCESLSIAAEKDETMVQNPMNEPAMLYAYRVPRIPKIPYITWSTFNGSSIKNERQYAFD